MTTREASGVETLEAVLRLADRGWRLFPCVTRGKIPAIGNWPNRASSNANVIRLWAQEHPRCNWAVACGPGSAIWALDIDEADGEVSRRALIDQHGLDWTKTLTAKTARGLHLYYQYPRNGDVKTSAGKVGAGLDIRGYGGYCIVPPSGHSSGHQYEWINPRQAVASAPSWLLERVAASIQRTAVPNDIGILPEGRRNDGLTRLAGALRRRGATQEEIEMALAEHNARRCRPPLPEQEVRRIAVSVVRYGPGGPDPLERAWQATERDVYQSSYERFLALARELQRARPEQPIALPLERIADLMHCDWTLIRRHRKRAVMSGILRRVADYVAHRRAAQYRVTAPPLGVGDTRPNKAVPLVRPTSGLVGQPQEFSLVVHPCDTTRESPNGTAPRCYVHSDQAVWWRRSDGDWVCGLCHPPTGPRSTTVSCALGVAASSGTGHV